MTPDVTFTLSGNGFSEQENEGAAFLYILIHSMVSGWPISGEI